MGRPRKVALGGQTAFQAESEAGRKRKAEDGMMDQVTARRALVETLIQQLQGKDDKTDRVIQEVRQEKAEERAEKEALQKEVQGLCRVIPDMKQEMAPLKAWPVSSFWIWCPLLDSSLLSIPLLSTPLLQHPYLEESESHQARR